MTSFIKTVKDYRRFLSFQLMQLHEERKKTVLPDGMQLKLKILSSVTI